MFFRCQALLTDKLIPGATTAEAKARRHNGTAARHAIRTIKPTWDTDLFKKNKVSIKIIYIYIYNIDIQYQYRSTINYRTKMKYQLRTKMQGNGHKVGWNRANVKQLSTPLHSWWSLQLLLQVSYYKAQGDYYRPRWHSFVVCARIAFWFSPWTSMDQCCPWWPNALQIQLQCLLMCLRYMAEINDDMDRTRATTAAKAAYEVGAETGWEDVDHIWSLQIV